MGLVAEPVWREFAPGLRVRCWGYNGQTPGPVIEAVEGDRVRIFVTNRLPEVTSVHWHGIILPNGQDGVTGLLQPGIEPGETFIYEFAFKHPGTFMYHPHADEMVQIGVGMMGMIVVHPKPGNDEVPPVDRDFAILLHEWAIHPGTYRPDPSVMPGPENTLPMMGGKGPYGPVGMGGMFTLVKIRENLESYDKDPGWHVQPPGTSARRA